MIKYIKHLIFPTQLVPLADNWSINYIEKNAPGYNKMAFYNLAKKAIYIRYKKDTWFEIHARNHEIGHSYEIKGCKRPWCLLFELEQWKKSWKDSIWEKLAAPLQFLRGLRYCNKCADLILKG